MMMMRTMTVVQQKNLTYLKMKIKKQNLKLKMKILMQIMRSKKQRLILKQIKMQLMMNS